MGFRGVKAKRLTEMGIETVADITNMTKGYMNEISSAITTDTTKAQSAFSTTLTNFNTGLTFTPQIRQPSYSSISPHVSGYNYRTSTGHEIIVDDEIIELRSDKARIYIDDTGIHLEGDVFINGKKI